MIDRITPTQERRIIRGIEKAIARTRSGASPDEAMIKVAVEMKFTPEITKRACEAFNKSKTVHVLTSRTSENRAEPFDHIDPAKVLDAVFKSEKTASERSLGWKLVDYSDKGLSFDHDVLTKSAADTEPLEKAADEITYKRDLKARMDMLDRFDKRRSEVRQLGLLSQESIMKAAEQMRYMPTKELRKVAHTVVNRYGDVGVSVLKVVSAKIQKDLPLEKTAHGAVLPLKSPYPELDKAISYARAHADGKETLRKEAEAAAPFFFNKEADDLTDMAKADAAASMKRYGGRAVMTGLGMGTGLFKGFKKGLSGEVENWRKIIQPKPEPQLLNVLNPSFLARLNNIDNMQDWVDVAADPGISKYPIQDITSAYNNIVNVAPSMKKPSMKPALISMVKRQLAQNQMMDPAEVNQLTELEKNRADIDKRRREEQEATLKNLVLPERIPQPGLREALGVASTEELEAKAEKRREAFREQLRDEDQFRENQLRSRRRRSIMEHKLQRSTAKAVAPTMEELLEQAKAEAELRNAKSQATADLDRQYKIDEAQRQHETNKALEPLTIEEERRKLDLDKRILEDTKDERTALENQKLEDEIAKREATLDTRIKQTKQDLDQQKKILEDTKDENTNLEKAKIQRSTSLLDDLKPERIKHRNKEIETETAELKGTSQKRTAHERAKLNDEYQRSKSLFDERSKAERQKLEQKKKVLEDTQNQINALEKAKIKSKDQAAEHAKKEELASRKRKLERELDYLRDTVQERDEAARLKTKKHP